MSEDKNKIFFTDDGFSRGQTSLKGKYKYNWVEDNLNFDSELGSDFAIPGLKEHVGKSFSFRASKYFIALLGFLFLFFFGRVFYLQILKGDDYYARAENNRLRSIPIVAERGLVFDRNGEQLTKNIPSFALAIFPQDIPKKRDDRAILAQKLHELTKKPLLEITELLEEYRKYTYESLVIQDNLDYDTALLAQIQASDLPGIHIQAGSKRLYTLTEEGSPTSTLSLAHILGYEGKIGPNEWKVFNEESKEFEGLFADGYLPSDLLGKTGIEKIYERELRGTYGKRQIEVDARGKEQLLLGEEAPVSGKHLKLTIDVNIQRNFERILQEHLDKNEKFRASGIVMNPNNGEILAMVSLPSFDNNDFSGGISLEDYSKYIENPNNPLFNRSIAGTYPSGSVVKPAVGAAALFDGVVSKNKTFLSNGGLRVGQWFFPDWQAGGHGRSNLRRSLAWSVNTYFYYVGGGYSDFVGLGVDNIVKYLKTFGLSEKLGIDLPGEAKGFLPSKSWKEEVKGERWYVGDTYNLSIGQGDLLVTPLQIASLTSVVATRGKLYQPHIGYAIIENDFSSEEKKEKQLLNEQVLNWPSLDEARLGMRDCVIYGSCRRLSTLPVPVAGKTGTAQWSSVKDNHAWFTSFAPFDSPEVVVSILVEEGEEGSGVAAPIAYDFYNWWWGYRNR